MTKWDGQFLQIATAFFYYKVRHGLLKIEQVLQRAMDLSQIATIQG